MSLQASALTINISKLISNFFNPITSLLLYFIYFSMTQTTLDVALERIIPILTIVILPVCAWIIYNVKTGRYTNMDVSNRKQRHSLYIVLVVVLSLYLGYQFIINQIIDYELLYLTILLLLMQLSNFFIKSSMHTALNIYVATLFFKINPTLGVAWFVLSIIIGITRIILKRHTIQEVIAGAVLASIVGLIFINF